MCRRGRSSRTYVQWRHPQVKNLSADSTYRQRLCRGELPNPAEVFSPGERASLRNLLTWNKTLSWVVEERKYEKLPGPKGFWPTYLGWYDMAGFLPGADVTGHLQTEAEAKALYDLFKNTPIQNDDHLMGETTIDPRHAIVDLLCDGENELRLLRPSEIKKAWKKKHPQGLAWLHNHASEEVLQYEGTCVYVKAKKVDRSCRFLRIRKACKKKRAQRSV